MNDRTRLWPTRFYLNSRRFALTERPNLISLAFTRFASSPPTTSISSSLLFASPSLPASLPFRHLYRLGYTFRASGQLPTMSSEFEDVLLNNSIVIDNVSFSLSLPSLPPPLLPLLTRVLWTRTLQGTGTIKAGFAGQDHPKCFFPTWSVLYLSPDGEEERETIELTSLFSSPSFLAASVAQNILE